VLHDFFTVFVCFLLVNFVFASQSVGELLLDRYIVLLYFAANFVLLLTW